MTSYIRLLNFISPKGLANVLVESDISKTKRIVELTARWLKWPQRYIAPFAIRVKILNNYSCKQKIIKKEEAKLIPCSSSCVQWKIKYWSVMWLRNTSLWLFSKIAWLVQQSPKRNVLNKGCFKTHQRMLESLLTWDIPQNKSTNPPTSQSDLHEVAKDVDQELVKNHQGIIML